MASPSGSRHKTRLSKVTILVVDDDKAIANLIKNVLKNLGFGNVIVTYNADEGMQVIEHNAVDLVITDWEMEPVNGIEMVQKIRKMDSLKRFTPIIMLTGHGEKQEIEQARDVGITEYLIKPFTAKTLCSRIATVVEAPRSFIVSREYKGPSRRRRVLPSPDGTDRRKRKTTPK